MKYKSYLVYDDDDFFEQYIQKRSKGNAPNELLEQPVIDELLGEVKGKEILDLGCGDGNYGKELLNRGAKYYVGIEGSINMFNLAKKNLDGFHFNIINQDIEKIKLKPEKYDIILSRLVFHYIEDLESVLHEIEKSLRKGGKFVLSIEHPVITSCYDSYHSKPKKRNWLVDNYFSSGERTNNWINKEVIKYHKTIEEYWNLFKSSNFEVSEIRESKPIASNFDDSIEFERRKRIPLFMMFKLQKK